MKYEVWLKEVVKPLGGEVLGGVLLTRPEKLEGVMRFLRDNVNNEYKVLIDVTGVDWYERREGNRFEVVYHLLSVRYSRRLSVKVSVDSMEGVPTITELYPVSNWMEREVWDMFGIEFKGHPDMRRLLTDYGFEGHPLRKDYPLTGYVEVRYDEKKKSVVTEGVELTKER